MFYLLVMGGAVSSGEDNADLVDKLVEGDYIKDQMIERVFRAVDRGEYFLPAQRTNAYKDQAWKHGNVHLSAPCIYAEVMEWLKIGHGMSFLNLGSGTGYLSTMAGLILGPYGVNHGVEYHQDVIDYAEERLQHFIKTCEAFDEFEFCEPLFLSGNCLLLSPTCRLYDRLYCGAACPSEHENYMKNLIKVGGILVMPLNDQLVQVTRTSETDWETKMIIPVSFARLISPDAVEPDAEFKPKHEGAVGLRFGPGIKPQPTDLIDLPNPKIMSLKEIARLIIRRVLLRNIRAEHPSVSRKRPRKSRKKRQPPAKQRRINLVPMDTGLMFVGQFSDDSDWENSREGQEQEQEEQERRERQNARDLSWGDQLRNTLFTRLFGPRLTLLPPVSGQPEDGEVNGGDQMEIAADAQPKVDEEDNIPAEDTEVDAAVSNVKRSADEPMSDANRNDNNSRQSSSEEASDTSTVKAADVKEAEKGEMDVKSEQNIPCSSSDATTDTTAALPVGRPSNGSTALVTSPRFTETSNSSAADHSTSCSSGVETLSSVDADSAESENLSSIFWTSEFQSTSKQPDSPTAAAAASKESKQSNARHEEEEEEGEEETETSHESSSPTFGFERRRIFDQLFEAACSSFDDELLKGPEENEEEEEDAEDEPMDEAEGNSESIVTYRLYLQRNMELLPVPTSLKNYLLFFRN